MRKLVIMDKKIAFITGISRGIGLEIAKSFVNDDYFVIGTSRSSFRINEELNSENCMHLLMDVTDREQISSCFDELKKINKIPNVLINNAGITKDQLFLRMKDGKNILWTYKISTSFLFNKSSKKISNSSLQAASATSYSFVILFNNSSKD